MIFKSKPRDANVIEFKHRYKWRLEELIIVGVLYAAAATFAIFGFINEMEKGLFIWAGVFLLLALAVTYLGASRKHKSRLKGIYDVQDTKLTIWGHDLKESTNTGFVKDVTRVYVKKVSKTDPDAIDPKDTIVLANAKRGKITIPMRIAQKHGLIDVIEAVITKTKPNDKLVEKFIDAAKVWRG